MARGDNGILYSPRLLWSAAPASELRLFGTPALQGGCRPGFMTDDVLSRIFVVDFWSARVLRPVSSILAFSTIRAVQ